MSDIDNAVSDADADLWAVQMPSGEVYTVTVDQLDDAFQRGLIDENTLVMQSGMDDWMSLGDVLGTGSDDSSEDESPVQAQANDDAGWPSAEEPVAQAQAEDNEWLSAEAPVVQAQTDDTRWPSEESPIAEAEVEAQTEPSEYASDRVSAELGLAAPPAADPTDDLFNRLIAPAGAGTEEEPTQREMALSRPGNTTLLNYPPPPQAAEAFATVAPLVQAAATMGVATPPPAPLRAPEPVAYSAPPTLSRPVPPPASTPTLSRPVPPPASTPALSRPVPPPADAAPYSRPPSQLPPLSRPVPPPASAAPPSYSRPVPPPADAAPYSRPVPPPAQPASYSRPVPPPSGSQFPTARGSVAPAMARPSAPPQSFGGVYPPPVISSAPSEPPGFTGPKSTPPLAYDVGDLDIPAPKFKSRGRGAMLAVAASIALVGGAVGLSSMDGSSLQLFPQSSSPVAAAKPYTPPPPAKPAPKPEPAPEPVVAKPPEPVAPKAAEASEAKLADDMKKALSGAKVKPTKAPKASKASMRPNVRRGGGKSGGSSSGALGKGGDKHDPLNGSL